MKKCNIKNPVEEVYIFNCDNLGNPIFSTGRIVSTKKPCCKIKKKLKK